MSTIAPVCAPCPRCGLEVVGEVVLVGNLDRRGAFEQRVLDRTLNRLRCTGCGLEQVASRSLAMFSFDKKRWLICYPAWAERHWADLARAVDQGFHRNRCAMPTWMRGSPSDWKVRVTFGHEQLREKFVIWAAALDEADVETAKLAMIARLGAPALRGILLEAAQPDSLVWRIGDQLTEGPRGDLGVASPEGCPRFELFADAYVQHRRWIVAPSGADPIQFDLDGTLYSHAGGAALRTPIVDLDSP